MSLASEPEFTKAQAVSAPPGQRPQTLSIVQKMVAQIPGVGVQDPGLRGDCVSHARVAMPDDGDVVVKVHISATVHIIKPDPVAAHQMQGRVVEDIRARPHHFGPPRHHGGDVLSAQRCGMPGGSGENRCRFFAAKFEQGFQGGQSAEARLADVVGLASRLARAGCGDQDRDQMPGEREVEKQRQFFGLDPPNARIAPDQGGPDLAGLVRLMLEIGQRV